MRGLARLTLVGSGVERPVLEKYLKSTQVEINPIQVGQHAVEVLLSQLDTDAS
jgi:hypothetical protein